jgi:hypothetical protein
MKREAAHAVGDHVVDCKYNNIVWKHLDAPEGQKSLGFEFSRKLTL